MSSSLPSDIGPFIVRGSAPVPGPHAWYLATRRSPGDGPGHAWVRHVTAPELPTLTAAWRSLSGVTDRRLPQTVALYSGVPAVAVRAPLGAPLSALLSLHVPPPCLTLGTVLDLALNVTEALLHAHKHGLHHGALDATWVTLGEAGQVVVWGVGWPRDGAPLTTSADERARARAADQRALGELLRHLAHAATSPNSPPSNRHDLAVGPPLGRITKRMLAKRPADRYGSLHTVRRDLLALTRRVRPAQTPALGALLASSTSPPSPQRPPMATPPRIQLQMPSNDGPEPAAPAAAPVSASLHTDVTDADTARPPIARALARAGLPLEPLPVLRPEVGAYGPASAPLQAATAPLRAATAKAIAVSPQAVEPVAVVAVEFDEFDNVDDAAPGPLGLSLPTDDLPLPSAEDVFGGIDVLGGDPLDAPAAVPGMGVPHAGPTAVPTTDPGMAPSAIGDFHAISLDDPDTDDVGPGIGFFSVPLGDHDRSKGLHGQMHRVPSRIERVAQVLMAANALLGLLWVGVRLF